VQVNTKAADFITILFKVYIVLPAQSSLNRLYNWRMVKNELRNIISIVVVDVFICSKQKILRHFLRLWMTDIESFSTKKTL